MNVTVKTFAQLREITQEGSFTLTLPDNIVTMGDVITLLKSRSDKWAQALGANADSENTSEEGHENGSENGSKIVGKSAETDAGNNSSVLMARNQQLCDVNTHVESGDELAFFPPVTGG
ncbi:MoaD/ThiS family protein [Alteromonas sp. 1_MG-2023]|uniref:MoaD/ThiS family protein n=1 Tax=Alteromonas sp. 1_MG-2023 TaxID=3062669 RepID=UPI0026E37CA0|nr:MoaD/ThiS family protein [Alteromonas sp. 1_MG-2023]MDO6569217.1 MoaD/ThiS family protein [Alteromonas sp. 1_MG-2023]